MSARSALAKADRRWERRPDDRPRLLMASALRLLKRDGYRRVKLEDVAREAGVSKATVYHYFDNKDDLLTQSVASRMAEQQSGIEQRLARTGGSAANRLRAYLRHFWKVSLTVPSGLWQRLMIAEVASEAPGLFDAWARGLARRWALVQRLIEEGQRTGEFRADADATVAARVMLSALAYQALFHVHLGVRRIAPCSNRRIVESSLDVLLSGLAADPRSR